MGFVHSQVFAKSCPAKIASHAVAPRAAATCVLLKPAKAASIPNHRALTPQRNIQQPSATSMWSAAMAAAAGSSSRTQVSTGRRNTSTRASSVSTEAVASWEDTAWKDQELQLVMGTCQTYSELGQFIAKYQEQCSGKFGAFIMLMVSPRCMCASHDTISRWQALISSSYFHLLWHTSPACVANACAICMQEVRACTASLDPLVQGLGMHNPHCGSCILTHDPSLATQCPVTP